MADHSAFPEHLRQVHFVLVAVAAGLLITIFAEDDAKPARGELEKIRRIVDSWDACFLQTYVSNRMVKRLELSQVERLIATDNRPSWQLEHLRIATLPFLFETNVTG